jgi:hypothetical protein
MSRGRGIVLLVGLAGVCWCGPAMAGPITLDAFTDSLPDRFGGTPVTWPVLFVSDTSTPPVAMDTASQTLLPGVYAETVGQGARRTTLTGGAGETFVWIGGDGVVTVDPFVGSTSTLLLEYGATNGPLNLDLTPPLTDLKIEDFLGEVDVSRQVRVSVKLTDGSGGSDTQSMLVGDGTTPVDLLFSLGSFGGVDLGDIDAISVEFDTISTSAAAIDYSFGVITVVPEPHTLAVFGLGSVPLGMAYARRRRGS